MTNELTDRRVQRLLARTRPDAVGIVPAAGPPGEGSRLRSFWAQILNGLEVGQAARYAKTGADYTGYYLDEVNPVTFAAFHPSRSRDADNAYQSLVATNYGSGANTPWVPLKFGSIVNVRVAVAEAAYIYRIHVPIIAPVMVLVTKDGGTQAGDATHDCDYTYEVRSMHDDVTVIATDQPPERPRWPLTKYLYAGEGGSTRYGLWDPFGEKLLVAFGEIIDPEDCD